MRKKFLKSEEGQSVVEFSLILVILINLLCVPIELFRFINTRTTLCSAATESLTQVKYESAEKGDLGLSSDILGLIGVSYGDRFDVGEMVVLAEGVNTQDQIKTEDYDYWVYSSRLVEGDNEPALNQFERRNASYKYATVKLKLAYKYEPVTWFGAGVMRAFRGPGDIYVETPTYQTVIYADRTLDVPEGGEQP